MDRVTALGVCFVLVEVVLVKPVSPTPLRGISRGLSIKKAESYYLETWGRIICQSLVQSTHLLVKIHNRGYLIIACIIAKYQSQLFKSTPQKKFKTVKVEISF